MIIAICLTLIILSILSFSIISEARVNFNFYGDDNFISFFLFGVCVVKINASLYRSTTEPIALELKSKEKVLARITADDIRSGGKSALSESMPRLFTNLDIMTVDIDAEYGDENAFSTVITSLTLSRLIFAALRYVASTQRVKTQAQVTPVFNRRSLSLRASGIFSITLADIIYGILFSKKESKKQ